MLEYIIYVSLYIPSITIFCCLCSKTLLVLPRLGIHLFFFLIGFFSNFFLCLKFHSCCIQFIYFRAQFNSSKMFAPFIHIYPNIIYTIFLLVESIIYVAYVYTTRLCTFMYTAFMFHRK